MRTKRHIITGPIDLIRFSVANEAHRFECGKYQYQVTAKRYGEKRRRFTVGAFSHFKTPLCFNT